MAKLHAHGRELYRLTRSVPSKDDPDLTFRYTQVIMSDDVVLQKVDFLGSHRHSSGWKRYGRVKPGRAEAYRDVLLRKGWVLS